jgi:hypothetical protein
VFAQFPAHCVSRVANPPYRPRQALLRDAELVSPVLYFVGLQEAYAGPVRRSPLGGRLPCKSGSVVGATATSPVRSGCTEQRPGIEAQRQAVATYLNRGSWRIIAEFTEIESGKRSDRPALEKAACSRCLDDFGAGCRRKLTLAWSAPLRTRLSLAPVGCTLVAPPLALCSSLSEISDGQLERCNRLSVNSQIHLSG